MVFRPCSVSVDIWTSALVCIDMQRNERLYYTEYLACRVLDGRDVPGLVIEMKVVGLV